MRALHYIRTLLAAAALILLAGQSVAQTPSIIATTASATVAVNTPFQVTFTLYNGRSQSFTPPSFDGFAITGSMRSSGGGSTVIINGQVVQQGESEEKWTYTLVPRRLGKIEIKPLAARVNNKIVESNSLMIEVVAGGARGQTNPPQPSSPAPQQQQRQATQASGDEVFVRASVDNSNPVQGQKIVVTYKLYTSLNISQYGITKTPGLPGFWVEELSKGQQAKQYQETINGKPYIVVELKKQLLYPQKSGKLNIEPLDLDAIVRIQVKGGTVDPFFDQFFNNPFFGNPFGGTYQNEKRSLRSNALTINVSSLPVAGKPADFTGGVGNFKLKAELSKSEIAANDATNLKITLSGSGNLKLMETPELRLPTDLDVFDPKITDNLTATEAGLSGSRTFDYTIIPRNAGEYILPALTFSYYDPAAKRYISLSTPEYTLNVSKGQNSGVSMPHSSVGRGDIQYLGQDIQFIKTKSPRWNKNRQGFFLSIWFFAGLLLPLLLFIASILWLQHRIREAGDIAKLKNRKARSVARKHLRNAEKLLTTPEKTEDFFAEISNASWNYLADKLNMNRSELSLENVLLKLAEKDLEQDFLNSIKDLLEQCEYARYAPGNKQQIARDLFASATDVISNLEKRLK